MDACNTMYYERTSIDFGTRRTDRAFGAAEELLKILGHSSNRPNGCVLRDRVRQSNASLSRCPSGGKGHVRCGMSNSGSGSAKSRNFGNSAESTPPHARQFDLSSSTSTYNIYLVNYSGII